MILTRIKSGATAALALATLAASAADVGPPLVATSIKGEVIRHASSMQTAVAEKGTIEPGQLVETRAGAGVQLDFLGAIDVTLGPGAALMYHSAQGQQLRVKLGAGDFEALIARDADLRFNVGPLRARAVGARVAGRVRADGATICVLQGVVSVQTPAGEKRLDKAGQCLERKGSEEIVRGPGADGAHPLPPEPVAPMVGATALPPPPPAALSSTPTAPAIPSGMAANPGSIPPPASSPPPASAPPPATSAAPGVASAAPATTSATRAAPRVTSTVALAPRPIVEAPPVVGVVIEHAPRATTSVAVRPRPVATATPAPPAAAVPAPSATATASPAPPPAATASPTPVAAPAVDLAKIGKPALVVITPFAEVPETTRVAMNPQRVTESPPPVPAASPPAAPPPAATVSAPSSTPASAPSLAPADAAPSSAASGSVDIPPLASGWTVVIAALNSPSGATEQAQRLRVRGLPADIFVFMKDGQKMYRLGLGRFRSYEAAAEYAARVRKELPEYQPWIAAFGAAPS